MRSGEHCAILVHEPATDHDLDDLVGLAVAVVSSGASAIMWDLRGHGGSDGEWRDGCYQRRDLSEQIAWARSQFSGKIAVISVGWTVYPTLDLAEDAKIDPLVLISPTSIEMSGVELSRFRAPGASKLIVIGGADPDVRRTASMLLDRSIGWTLVTSVGSPNEGTGLLSGHAGDRTAEHIAMFLRDQWGRRRSWT